MPFVRGMEHLWFTWKRCIRKKFLSPSKRNIFLFRPKCKHLDSLFTLKGFSCLYLLCHLVDNMVSGVVTCDKWETIYCSLIVNVRYACTTPWRHIFLWAQRRIYISLYSNMQTNKKKKKKMRICRLMPVDAIGWARFPRNIATHRAKHGFNSLTCSVCFDVFVY